MNSAPHVESVHTHGDLAAVLDTTTFPAAREDLLLHAIASHATPSLIGDLRALAESWFEDAAAVRDALASL